MDVSAVHRPNIQYMVLHELMSQEERSREVRLEQFSNMLLVELKADVFHEDNPSRAFRDLQPLNICEAFTTWPMSH